MPLSLTLARSGWSTVIISFQIWSKTSLQTASLTQALGVTGGRPREPRSRDLRLPSAGPSSLQKDTWCCRFCLMYHRKLWDDVYYKLPCLQCKLITRRTNQMSIRSQIVIKGHQSPRDWLFGIHTTITNKNQSGWRIYMKHIMHGSLGFMV